MSKVSIECPECNENKVALLELLAHEDINVISQAYLYARNLREYGVDVSTKWETVMLQSEALEKAYQKGIHDQLSERGSR